MVDASVAGVLFTADPVTGRRRQQTVIDASPGLGEAVVSGAVNPDHFVVDTATGAILDRRHGDKTGRGRARLPGGGVEQVDAAAEAAGALPHRRPGSRAGRARASGSRTHYGTPQDTEWAIDADGALWLTQARPITTLYPRAGAARPTASGCYVCFSLAQGLTRPITPMGMAAFRLIGASVGHGVRLTAGAAARRSAGLCPSRVSGSTSTSRPCCAARSAAG